MIGLLHPGADFGLFEVSSWHESEKTRNLELELLIVG